ncbi:Stemmadenine O-acetyltransferase, partial [Linum perenne]
AAGKLSLALSPPRHGSAWRLHRKREQLPSQTLNPFKPALELQLSVFSCGGISFGWAASHKLVDGSTMKAFLDTFSPISKGNQNDVISPDFFTATELFPPRVPSPENYLNLLETL